MSGTTNTVLAEAHDEQAESAEMRVAEGHVELIEEPRYLVSTVAGRVVESRWAINVWLDGDWLECDSCTE